MGTQVESQWAVARGLLSTLRIPGMIHGVRDNRNRMLRTVLRLGRRFGPFLLYGKFSLTRVSCGTARGGTQDASTQEDES